MATLPPKSDVRQVEEIFQRIAGDLGMIADRPLKIQPAEVERVRARIAGSGQVHISFKLGFQHAGTIQHGCLLMPLSEAISIASYLMMMPDDVVKSKRELTSLDGGTKDAMLEIGNFIGGAADAALRSIGFDEIRVRSESCQGVPPDVRPAFVFQEGTPLIAGRAKAQLFNWPAFEMILMLPVLEPLRVNPAAA